MTTAVATLTQYANHEDRWIQFPK